jgi:hypothetical protein
MYGFSGYGTNEYASERQASSIIAPVVRLATRVVANAYNAALVLTLSNPSQNQRTLEL